MLKPQRSSGIRCVQDRRNGGAMCENVGTASTANEAARATAAKRSPGQTITDLGVTA